MWSFSGDAHRDDEKRFVVRADEILTAFLEFESLVRAGTTPKQMILSFTFTRN
jgi:hypothetical protein